MPACYWLVQIISYYRSLSEITDIDTQRAIILPVGLYYGCETWSLTLMEKQKLRMFENRLLRRIFGPKRDKVTKCWRRMHEELMLGTPHQILFFIFFITMAL
jgi:hypothetical protein